MLYPQAVMISGASLLRKEKYIIFSILEGGWASSSSLRLLCLLRMISSPTLLRSGAWAGATGGRFWVQLWNWGSQPTLEVVWPRKASGGNGRRQHTGVMVSRLT